jgi:PAS domain S-box-containing protein
METHSDRPAAEIKRLQRCINDLVSVLAVSAVWTGGEPTQIVRTLLDVLLGLLDLDFAYVRLNGSLGTQTIELSRISQSAQLPTRPQEIGEILKDWLGPDPQRWVPRVQNSTANGDFSIVPVRLGLQADIGFIVVGSRRPHFPGQTEKLVLDVAANQAAIGLQEARLLSEQKRVATELDQRVAERTKALAATNEELRREIAERQRAEEALSVRDLQLRLLVDSIAAPVAVMTVTGEVDVVNASVLEYFGKTLEELKSWSTIDAVHPDDLAPTVAAWMQAVESGRPYEIESRHRRADGVYRWFHVRGFPMLDTDGRIIRWCVLQTDIDDRKKAEQALSASERNLNLTINTIPALVWSARTDGTAEFFNQHYLDYIGLTSEQAQGWGWTAAVHPEDGNRLAAAWQAIMASGEVGEAEGRLRGCDGQYRWFLFRANPLRDESGSVVKWFGVNTDIETRKHAEQALFRSEAFLSKGQELSLTGSFSWDFETGTFTWSNQLYRIYEFEPGTPVTFELISTRYHPEDKAVITGVAEQARSGVANFDYAHRLLMPDGSIKHVHVVAHGSRTRDGRLEYFGAVQDVTERRLSEEALGRVRAELAHVTRVTSLGAMTASIAHEINQPLASIITNAGTCVRMLTADPPNLVVARRTAQRTIDDGNRAAEVVKRLRALFAKKGTMTDSVDLNEAAREVIALSFSELQRGGTILQIQFADALPPVAGDRVQLQQVIHNLLLNASDAMSNITDRPRRLVISTALEADDHVHLTVQDAGVGIDPQHAERLFDAFYSTKSHGMGIGLFVSRSIIENHNGRLWAEPNDGPGAKFLFSIPRLIEDMTSIRTRHG